MFIASIDEDGGDASVLPPHTEQNPYHDPTHHPLASPSPHPLTSPLPASWPCCCFLQSVDPGPFILLPRKPSSLICVVFSLTGQMPSLDPLMWHNPHSVPYASVSPLLTLFTVRDPSPLIDTSFMRTGIFVRYFH